MMKQSTPYKTDPGVLPGSSIRFRIEPGLLAGLVAPLSFAAVGAAVAVVGARFA